VIASGLIGTLALGGCEAEMGADAGADAAAVDAGTDAGDPSCEVVRDAGLVVRPDAGPVAAPPTVDCGAPTFPSGTGLRRYPYLQSVTRTSARVAWTSTSGGDAVVRFATSVAGPWTEVAAMAEAFDVARTDDSESYVAYDAVLSGLGANAAYCYEVVEDGVVLASGLSLDTAWDGTDRPIRVLAFGDSGTSSAGQLALRDEILAHEFDIFLHLGDMAYDTGTFPEFEASFFEVYRDLMHRVPAFPTMGNHEYATSIGRPYLDVYYLFEQALRPAENERYYSFDYGNVHFVSLDSNEGTLIPILLDTNGRMSDDMVDWLIDDLAASDAEWKIAFFHHPPYTSSSRGPSNAVRQLLLDVLEEGGVDLVLVGHDHHYERTLPIRHGCFADERTGITFVVNGAGGAGLRDTAFDNWYTADLDDTVHNFVSLTIRGCVARGQAIDATGAVIDDWSLDGCD
jgi:3',5'-cyclic AMP phosphodiesterase CpdA